MKQFSNKSFGRIFSVTIDKTTKRVFTIDDHTFLNIKHRGSNIFTLDTGGIVKTRFGRDSSYNGDVSWYHDIAVDDQQNIYVGDILGNKVQKFKKIVSR